MNYASNSHKTRELKQKETIADKKIEKVINGKARSKKKSEMKKFADVFITEDVNDVKSYILMDVLVPAIKKAVSDIIVNGIDMLLYGETGYRKDSNKSRVSYRSYYDRPDRRDREESRRRRTSYDYDDIILDTRGEAEEVLTKMDDLIDTYGIVSVADLYELVGIDGNYTDNKYGWTDLRNANVVRLRDGYMLKLPKALPIN